LLIKMRMGRPSSYYRSHAAYSKATNKYVLWLNAEPGQDSDCAACADPESGNPTHCYLAGTADSPAGPFAYHGVVPVRYTFEGGVGDFELFVDDDANGTGYVMYKRTGSAPGANGHRMTLQQLTPDLLGVVESASVGMQTFAAAPFVEAPAMFKRRGVYYALFGKCCAFCAHGSGIGVWSSSGTPLGPWQPHGNIGCTSAAIAGQQFCGCAPSIDWGGRGTTLLPLTRACVRGVTDCALQVWFPDPPKSQPSKPELPRWCLWLESLSYRLGLPRTTELRDQAGAAEGED
jgi:hypothetical protein